VLISFPFKQFFYTNLKKNREDHLLQYSSLFFLFRLLLFPLIFCSCQILFVFLSSFISCKETDYENAIEKYYIFVSF